MRAIPDMVDAVPERAPADEIAALIRWRRPVHMAGIGGVGMAGLAFWLRRLGLPVSGCDTVDGPLCAWLREQGMEVAIGHDPRHVARDTAWLVHSTAVARGHAECRYAEERGLPVFRRGEVLPVIPRIAGMRTIAICGTHGKTTTACFVTLLLQACGALPGWAIGGQAAGLSGVAGAEGGEWLVVEADESDGTLACHAPDITVLTNVDFDHMEHFPSVEALETCYAAVLRRTRSAIVVCGACDRALALARANCGASCRLTVYGTRAECGMRIGAIEEAHGGLSLSLAPAGRLPLSLTIPVHGRHNAYNATGAIAAALAAGLTPDRLTVAADRLALPKRRFETVYDRLGIRILSDYAHHPTEIKVLIETARERFPGRLRAVFQPHRYTRTAALGKSFPRAFDGVHELVLTPVYAASEDPVPGGYAHDLYAHFRQAAGAQDPGPDRVYLADSPQQAWNWFSQTLREGDTLLVIGAGDVDWIATQARSWSHSPGVPLRLPEGLLSESSRLESDATLGRRTTFRLGGHADLLVTVGSELDFVALVRWCQEKGAPLHLHAAGSNVLVSDLGVRGVTVMLDRGVFGKIDLAGDVVIAGPACPLSRLLDWCEERGRGGLESLEGIPGSVGGAMRMNAGAWGSVFGDAVCAIRCLFRDGTIAMVEHAALGLGYRRCDVLERAFVLDVRLRLPQRAPAAIRDEREACAAKRLWQRGLRSAGSVFKNPPGAYAAQLIERAGLKGCRIGGAEVMRCHANIITADETAQASDVLALIGHVRACVRHTCGVELETEVICLA